MKTITMKRLRKEVREFESDGLHLKPCGFEWEIIVREPDRGGFVVFRTYQIPRSLAPLLSTAYHLGIKNQQKAIKEELGIRDGI